MRIIISLAAAVVLFATSAPLRAQDKVDAAAQQMQQRTQSAD